ncbi:MAG: DNA gyrase subunit A [Candidatus Paceibacterota bacterium]
MAGKKDANNSPEEVKKPHEGVISRSISTEMRESYLDYAMSVITARALPDVRDGLKPVHRRILYAMHEMNLTAGGRFRKSAAVVGDVLGKYHPHGDVAVYDAMAKLAQDFATRYPLVHGQGNFGSIDGDSPAAMRYTEAKMTRISAELLRDLEKDTVNWRTNYDNTRKEPIVLPAGIPNILLNGTLGIAVGMATNIPPHNLREIAAAVAHLVENEKASADDLFQFVKGPDFPTGGIIFNEKDIHHAYTNGKGGVVARGEAEITEEKKGNFRIIISSIPYRVNKADLISKVADLVHAKKLEGIKDIRDESTKDVRVVIELKSGAQPQRVLNYLYKHTQLEDTFHFNVVALVDGVPQTLSLKGILEEFIKHRLEVIKRRSEFDLRKAEDREHILLGLKRALDHIDEIIKLIRAAKDVAAAHAALMKTFKFSDKQSTAILEMRLQKLAGLERKKIEDELKSIQAFIEEIKELLANPKKMRMLIKSEVLDIADKYGDDRKTKVVKRGTSSISDEDLIPDEESILVLTKGGYIKRTNPNEYKRQKRGGVGVIDLNTKEEDFVTRFLTASTHSDILFFTDRGKVYQIKMYEFPEGRRATKGKSVLNFISLSDNETITSVLAVPKDAKESKRSLVMVTKEGTIKKVSAKSFYDVRRSGLIAIKLADKDELITADFLEKGDDIVVVTKKGQAIRFKEADAREMGRTAAGVRAIKLTKGDAVVGAGVVEKGAEKTELLVLSSTGYGKKTKLSEYKIQKRGGSGIKTANVTQKTGELMALRILDGSSEELIIISKKGQVIRTGLDEIPTLGRSTQGVRLMKLRAGDGIAALICF